MASSSRIGGGRGSNFRRSRARRSSSSSSSNASSTGSRIADRRERLRRAGITPGELSSNLDPRIRSAIESSESSSRSKSDRQLQEDTAPTAIVEAKSGKIVQVSPKEAVSRLQRDREIREQRQLQVQQQNIEQQRLQEQQSPQQIILPPEGTEQSDSILLQSDPRGTFEIPTVISPFAERNVDPDTRKTARQQFKDQSFISRVGTAFVNSLNRASGEGAFGKTTQVLQDSAKILGAGFDPFVNQYKKGDIVVNPQTQQTFVEGADKTIFDVQTEKNLRNIANLKTNEAIQKEVSKKVEKDLLPEYQDRADLILTKYQRQVNIGNLSQEQAQSKYEKEISKLNLAYQLESSQKFNQAAGKITNKRDKLVNDTVNITKPLTTGEDVVKSTAIALAIGGGAAGGIAGSTIGSIGNAAIASEGFGTASRGAIEGNIGKYALGGLQFSLGGYAAARLASNAVTLSRIKRLTNFKPSESLTFRSVNKGGTSIKDTSVNVIKKKFGTGISYGEQSSKLVTKNKFVTEGFNLQKVNVKDVWSGKPINLFSGNYNIGTGTIFPKVKGFTPATSKTANIDFKASLFKNKFNFEVSPKYTKTFAGKTTPISGEQSKTLFSVGGTPRNLYQKNVVGGGKVFSTTYGARTSKDTISLIKINQQIAGSSAGRNIISSGTKSGSISSIGNRGASSASKSSQVTRNTLRNLPVSRTNVVLPSISQSLKIGTLSSSVTASTASLLRGRSRALSVSRVSPRITGSLSTKQLSSTLSASDLSSTQLSSSVSSTTTISPSIVSPNISPPSFSSLPTGAIGGGGLGFIGGGRGKGSGKSRGRRLGRKLVIGTGLTEQVAGLTKTINAKDLAKVAKDPTRGLLAPRIRVRKTKKAKRRKKRR